MFNGFYPKTKSCNPADHTFKLFSQKVLHILYLLIFVGSSFCFHCCSFPFAAMLAFLLHLFIGLDILSKTCSNTLCTITSG